VQFPSSIGLDPGSEVGITGATVGTPTAGSAVAIRNVSASGAASAPLSGSGFGPGTVTASTTLIAAPGAGKKIELHTIALTVAITDDTLSSGGATFSATLDIEDATTGTVIAQVIASVVQGGNRHEVDQLAIDLQGATVTANHAVKAKLTLTFGGVASGIATGVVNTVTYNVIS
jgi:hypothetical protein